MKPAGKAWPGLALSSKRASAPGRGLDPCARVRDCSFGPGREYWRTTRADWPAVRSVQAELLARNPRAALVREVLETYPVPGKP